MTLLTRSGNPRSEHPIVLTLSTGRSGTSFLAHSVREAAGDRVAVYHEFLNVREAMPGRFHRSFDQRRLAEISSHPPVARAIERIVAEAKERPVVDFGWTMGPLVPLLHELMGDRLRIIVLNRHPVISAASMAVLGLYSNYPRPEEYMVTPSSEGARFPEFAALWAQMSEFEKCLYRWYEIASYGLELSDRFPSLPMLFLNSETALKDGLAMSQIANFCGLVGVSPAPSNHRNGVRVQNVETNPVGQEWRKYRKYPEIMGIGRALGFEFDDAVLGSAMASYQLPGTLGARLRYRFRYWLLRRKLGKALSGLAWVQRLRGSHP